MARILIIEDNDAVRQTFEIILQSAGHEVVLARDGRDGLTRLAQQRFDLVVTDIIMPHHSGVEVIARMRQNSQDAPILVISGSLTAKSVDFLDLARQMGADALLVKPVRTPDLLQAVDRLLAGRVG